MNGDSIEVICSICGNVKVVCDKYEEFWCERCNRRIRPCPGCVKKGFGSVSGIVVCRDLECKDCRKKEKKEK